ncbi:MAG: hypothetical protein R3C02_01730 [Planctomycetaceae bacterium]
MDCSAAATAIDPVSAGIRHHRRTGDSLPESDAMLGDVLFPAVSLAVAVILFEGSLESSIS